MLNLFGAVSHIYIAEFYAVQTMLKKIQAAQDIHVYILLVINAFNRDFLHFLLNSYLKKFFEK